MDIRFGELYSIEVEPTEVTAVGQDVISANLVQLTNIHLPKDWSWHWMVDRGEYRGRLPRRIASFFKKQCNVTLTSGNIATLGNLARQHCHVRKQYTFDFTKSFDWCDGDFGDSGSCFWGAREPAREVLMCNGVIAIRFYTGSRGTARAWIKEEGECVVVFNAYGLPCREISYVLSTLLNKNTQKVRMSISGDPDELIWLNADAHIIGPHMGAITLSFDVPYKYCSRCDEFVHKDNFDFGSCGRCGQ